jgi:hypothetical protein
MDWMCKNGGYQTHPDIGYEHVPGGHKGSVFKEPINGEIGDGPTLWLEHLQQGGKEPHEPLFWLMWYDRSGKPTLSASAIFSQRDLDAIFDLLGMKASNA